MADEREMEQTTTFFPDGINTKRWELLYRELRLWMKENKHCMNAMQHLVKATNKLMDRMLDDIFQEIPLTGDTIQYINALKDALDVATSQKADPKVIGWCKEIYDDAMRTYFPTIARTMQLAEMLNTATSSLEEAVLHQHVEAVQKHIPRLMQLLGYYKGSTHPQVQRGLMMAGEAISFLEKKHN